MESLGEKLKTAREKKGISFDQACRDTKISVRFLEALEKEHFSGIPGETYVVGFLRNYGAYLDLDVQEVLSLYRMLLKQEQPIPVEQLLKQPSPVPGIILKVALAVLILGVVFGGLYLLISRPQTPQVPLHISQAATEHTMSGDHFERRFYRGDSILVPFGQNQIRFELRGLGDEVTLHVQGRDILIELGQAVDVDIGSGFADLRISAVDFDKNNADMGVRLRFESVAFSSDPIYWTEQPETVAITIQASPTVIFSSPNPHPFTLQAVFQGNCLFRWEVLMERDRRERNERYFQRLDEWSIQAQNGVRIWVSNAQAARFQVIGGGRTFPVEIGGQGEVVVADIRWVRDEENRFRLIMARLETGG